MELLFGGILPYVAFAVFIGGTALRITTWLKKPVPFQLTLFPEPDGKVGKVAAVTREFLFFRTLYRESRLLWLWAWLFHFSLAMVIAGHMSGIYFLRSQFTLIGAAPETSILLSTVLGAVMGTIMIVSLSALLCRRLFSQELRKLSESLAWFDLLLLLAVALSGLGMYLPGYHADLPLVRTYMEGVFTLRPAPLPLLPIFVIHFSLVNFLLLYFPFSQLMHFAGFFANRAMLVEASPIFPTPAGKRLRSQFAGQKTQRGVFASREEADAREAPNR
jgi:nitrate reductase gamma subunit